MPMLRGNLKADSDLYLSEMIAKAYSKVLDSSTGSLPITTAKLMLIDRYAMETSKAFVVAERMKTKRIDLLTVRVAPKLFGVTRQLGELSQLQKAKPAKVSDRMDIGMQKAKSEERFPPKTRLGRYARQGLDYSQAKKLPFMGATVDSRYLMYLTKSKTEEPDGSPTYSYHKSAPKLTQKKFSALGTRRKKRLRRQLAKD